MKQYLIKNISEEIYGPFEKKDIKGMVLSGRLTLDFKIKESDEDLWETMKSTQFSKYFHLTDPKKVQRYFYALDDFEEIKKYETCILIDNVNDELELFFIKQKLFSTMSSDNVKEIDLEFTGDNYDSKLCDRCFKILPTEHFPNNREKKSVNGERMITKRPSCKECRKEKDGQKISKKEREIYDHEYKPDKYSFFCCQICNKTSIAGVTKQVLDHNHKTGAIRGYICESCNTGIGRFDDDKEILKNAIEWIEYHHK